MKRLIDLGCGQNKFQKEGFTTVGADHSSNSSADILCNLGFEKIPAEDDSFDYASAIQLLEHIPRVVYTNGPQGWSPHFPFIFLMNEIHRVLKDGAMLEVHVPMPHITEFHQDPTHVNGIVDSSWIYFHHEDRWGVKSIYHISASFALVRIEKTGWYKKYFLETVKNGRKPAREVVLPVSKSLLTKFARKLAAPVLEM